MNSRIKIIFIVVFFIASVFLLILFIIPNLSSSLEASSLIETEKDNNKVLLNRLNELLLIRDEYNVLNAEYQKCSMQLPSENDLSFFTNEIYEIAKYSDIIIYSVDYMERTAAEEDKEEQKTISVNIILESSYYNIVNFIKIIEKMPRIAVIEDIVLQSYEDDYKKLNGFVGLKIYYVND